MKSSLKERLGQLGQIKAIDRVPSGSPVVLTLHRAEGQRSINTIIAALSLAKRGMTMLQAKRAMETLLQNGEVTLNVQKVEDVTILAAELDEAGVVLTVMSKRVIDVRKLRERLQLTQEQFALQYGLDIDAIRNWEHGRRSPDTAAQSYLRTIDKMPDRVRLAQEEEVLIEQSEEVHISTFR
ncbi:helix-turn-helix domain-containing protein [Phyllobacterium myrsinacearum]|uniref:Putative transcriptional regulator n=1 Tax=Phyllobacterium myrsinacearum TaxID=28101 RepID=A0A839ERX4_9HYPH|nr:helix-turn-helix domain-containing protein [Phyllobacterium myrsinacearum]MBA8880865.1 putative transcriptional regulator [Phyllobacterium myrsinacearum]